MAAVVDDGDAVLILVASENVQEGFDGNVLADDRLVAQAVAVGFMEDGLQLFSFFDNVIEAAVGFVFVGECQKNNGFFVVHNFRVYRCFYLEAVQMVTSIYPLGRPSL